MYNFLKRPDEATLQLIRRTGDVNPDVSLAAQREFIQAITLPLREAILVGDNTDGLFTRFEVDQNNDLEYPLDLIAPGEENDLVAYTNPGNGRIAERQVQADYVKIHTYGITNSIDWLLKIARQASWDMIGRAMQIYEAGFQIKINNDGWATVLSSVADRNILVYDADATAGQFTKRLVSLSKIVIRRNGGGNSGSMNRFKATDAYISPEGEEDMRNWGLDQVDEVTRREIYLQSDGTLSKVFGVVLHTLDEFGVGQQYTNFFTQVLGGSLGSDVELGVMVDKSKGTFLMPIKLGLETFPDPNLHRSQKAGFYGWMEAGFLSADNRSAVAISY